MTSEFVWHRERPEDLYVCIGPNGIQFVDTDTHATLTASEAVNLEDAR